MSRQTTSLKTNIYESSLVWEIENFLDYSHCNIGEISSEIVEFKDFNASWQLFVFPKTEDDKIALKFKILSLSLGNERKQKALLKLDVRTEVTGNDMMCHANHHMGRTQGRYAEPVHEMHPALWSHDYMPVNEKMELWCEDFIDHKDLATMYLSGGSLKIYAEAFLKTVEVAQYFKE